MPEPEPLVDAPGLRPQIETFDEDEPSPKLAPPVREGLPPGFRMRADAHYVDQLDARMSSIPVRLIDTQSLESGAQQNGDAIAPAFVESVRRFGVLQPLLVSARGSRYRVIAGRRRLAAAVVAGLREVPCLVQHVDGDQAEQMALASNVPATRPRPAAQGSSNNATAHAATTELAQALAALASCADLLASGSALSHAVAVDLVRAEATKALDLLSAIRVLRDEVPVSRVRLGVRPLLELVARTGPAERRLKGVDLRVDAGADTETITVNGDPHLLSDAISNLVAVAASLLEQPQAPALPAYARSRMQDAAVVLATAAEPHGGVTFSVTQTVIDVPAAWLARPFEIAWPTPGGASALVRLQAARRVAQAHGGDVQIETASSGTLFALTLPIVA